jgi:hypothetical protein
MIRTFPLVRQLCHVNPRIFMWTLLVRMMRSPKMPRIPCDRCLGSMLTSSKAARDLPMTWPPLDPTELLINKKAPQNARIYKMIFCCNSWRSHFWPPAYFYFRVFNASSAQSSFGFSSTAFCSACIANVLSLFAKYAIPRENPRQLVSHHLKINNACPHVLSPQTKWTYWKV